MAKKQTAEQKRIRELLVRIGADKAFTVGGQSGVPAIAEFFDCTPQAVYKWSYAGRIPIEKAREIERVTDGRFTRLEMCPWAYA